MLITHDDIERAFGVSLSADEIDALDNEFIPNALADIETAIGRPVQVRTITGELHEVPWPNTHLALRESPVVSVQQVVVNGQVILPSDYDVYGSIITLRWSATLAGVLGTLLHRHYVVDYTAGLGNTVEGYRSVRAVALSASYRGLLRRRWTAAPNSQQFAGLKSLSVEGYSVTFDPTITSTGLVDDERATLQGFRRRRIR